MADIAIRLVRMIVRAFYTTEHILVLDALCYHSTLSDYDLGLVVGMNVKPVRKIAGRLKEDGLITIQTRMERRTDGGGGYFGPGSQQNGSGKERLTSRDWYYINFHKAIDSIKYRMWKLSKHVESLGASATEKKDLVCPQCHEQYTLLEVMDTNTGAGFTCRRCGHVLDAIPEEEKGTENEHMKRLNQQLEPFLNLMRQIDSTNVPENDFEAALAKHIPAKRDDDVNPAPRTETIDAPNRNIASTKGLEIKQELVSVRLQDDETVKAENEAEEARKRREKEARQNALPEWISKSTVTGEITTLGIKEENLRRQREEHNGGPLATGDADEKKPATAEDADVLDRFYAAIEEQRQKDAVQSDEEDDEDEDEDDFEDVGITGAAVNGVKGSGVSTPALESSNATDDERDAKRVKTEPTLIQDKGRQPPANAALMSGANGGQSDEDDDLDFEDVA